jgi:hypothetical protein
MDGGWWMIVDVLEPYPTEERQQPILRATMKEEVNDR